MSKLKNLTQQYQVDFNLPPSKEERKKYFGSSLIKSWNNEFKKRCWFIPYYPTISFHVLLGQLSNVKNVKINVGSSYEDCRIHMLLLQESGSGKGGGFTFLNKMAEKTNVIFHTIGDVTNAALVGTISPDGSGSTTHIPGALDPNYNGGQGVDIVACNEASSIVDKTGVNFGKDAILNLQKSMNTVNTADNVITKETGVGNKNIKFNTDVSFYLTTFEPENVFQTMTRTGFLQRLVLIYNPISLKDKWKVAKKHVSMLESDDGNDDSDIDNIVGALRYINMCYDGVESLGLTSKARNALKEEVLPLIYEPLIELESTTMSEVKKFTTRYQVMLYRIAWHHAITRLSKKVSIKDIAYARKVFIPIYKRLLAYMENRYSPTGEKRAKRRAESQMIEGAYKEIVRRADAESEYPWIRKPYLISKLGEKWEISKEGARQKLENHISLFKTDISKSNSVILKLRE